mmetsp:Transcript_3876/g.17858  ORF Transcript_3876/g.17858 Transcript_3876/m.17858 type:complete len:490 (+) Transcript_3876:186-1655(+)
MRPTPIPPHLRKGVACSMLLAIVMACNHFNRDAPGVVEEQLRVDPKLDVTPERYSTMTAMYFLPSSIVPLLLGLLSAVPKSQGGVPSVVVFVGVCIVSALGNFVAAVGAERGSFPTLLAGRGIAGAVYEAVDMTPLGFIPQLLPGRWGTVSGFINGVLRLGSVAAFGLLPIVYRDGGGDGGEGARAVFWTCALVAGCALPLAVAVNRIATGRANATLGLPPEGQEHPGASGEHPENDSRAAVDPGAMTTAASSAPPDGLSAAGAAMHALRSVPTKFWVYAGGSACMYGAVVPFWLYGAGFLQRKHRYSIDRAGMLMLIPELALCILSVPIGVAVDRFHFTFARCQRWYACGAATIAASHLGLGFGGSPLFFVLTLGVAYAFCNQLTWASFPGVCPNDLMSLGGGVVACCINLACAIVPACIGTVRSGSGDGDEFGMFVLLCACGLAAAGVGAALSAGVFDEDQFKYVDMKEETDEEEGTRGVKAEWEEA